MLIESDAIILGNESFAEDIMITFHKQLIPLSYMDFFQKRAEIIMTRLTIFSKFEL